MSGKDRMAGLTGRAGDDTVEMRDDHERGASEGFNLVPVSASNSSRLRPWPRLVRGGCGDFAFRWD